MSAYEPEEALDTLNYLLEIISEGIWDWEIGSGRVRRSPAWYRMLGYPVGCFEETVFTWESAIHPEDYNRVMAHFDDYLNGRSAHYRIRYRCLTADGQSLWIEDSGRIVARDEQGNPTRMIGAHNNIHDAVEAQQQLQQQNRLLRADALNLQARVQERTETLEQLNHELQEKVKMVEFLASHDHLTGTYNRRLFEEMLQKEIARANRYHQPLSVVLADIDLFKSINDRFGHHVGDQVLQQIAQTLQDNLRDSDTLARWGGEEFAMILPNTAKEEALELSDRLRLAIASLAGPAGEGITCSFGVTQLLAMDSSDALFNRMDHALYQAKAQNRNNVQCF